MDGLDPGITGRSYKTSGPLLPKRLVAQRYNVSTRTVDRWVANEALGFVQPIKINGRDYFHEHQLEAFELRRAVVVAA